MFIIKILRVMSRLISFIKGLSQADITLVVATTRVAMQVDRCDVPRALAVLLCFVCSNVAKLD